MASTYGIDHEALKERFCRYVAIDTRSDEKKAETVPSTPGQHNLAKLLYKEILEMGLEAYYDEENCYVYGRLPANKPGLKAIGFLAHLDTAPDLRGDCTNPQIFVYQGGDIKLNDEFTMAVEDFPILNDLVGEELITTDGTTLLGADNKAGITAIMEAVRYLLAHPEIPHGDISFAFPPDEEIGHGASLLDLDRFGADFAYTVDGDLIGDFNYETFNAASAEIEIQGRNVHPGTAKHIMVNASLIGMELQGLLPVGMRPEWTSGHDGFYLLTEFTGCVEKATLHYIIRDHDAGLFAEKKALLEETCAFLEKKYGVPVTLKLKDSYRNMREIMDDNQDVLELAYAAMREVGVEPDVSPIRGGTDGAQLSFRGLPCPNIFVGGYNFHGRYEFAIVRGMALAAAVVVKIAELNAEQN